MVRLQYSNKGYFTLDFESSANTICSALLALKRRPQTNPFTYGSAFISNHSPSSLVAFKLTEFWPQQCGRWCEITAQVKFRSLHTEDLFDLGVKYPSKTCSSHLTASLSAANLKMITRQGVGGWVVGEGDSVPRSAQLSDRCCVEVAHQQPLWKSVPPRVCFREP